MKIHLIHLLHRPWTMTSNSLLNLHLLQIKINPDISVSSVIEIILVIFATNSLRCRVLSFYITMNSIQMTALNASDTHYKSCNGLLKHQRGHLYMKYKCTKCEKFFQFPYQLNNHATVHTGVGKHQCCICSKTFSAKCSKDFHEKTHNVKIKCDLCPMSTSKEFNSTVAMHIHQRGMYQGWTTLCSKNYKRKSQYTCHNKSKKRLISN